MSEAAPIGEALPNVIIEDEAVEVTPQETTPLASSARDQRMARVVRPGAGGRSPVVPVSAAPEAGGSSSQALGQVPEVICLDSPPAPVRQSDSRGAPSGRKVRRLNDSTPVIVVDDDEVSPVCVASTSASGGANASSSRFGPENVGSGSEQRDDSSITPVLPRRRYLGSVHGGPSRARVARTNTTSAEIVIDESPPRDSATRSAPRDMPALGNPVRRTAQTSHASRSSRLHRAMRTNTAAAGASGTSSGRSSSARSRFVEYVVEYGRTASTTGGRSAAGRRVGPRPHQLNVAFNQVFGGRTGVQLVRRNPNGPGFRRVELHFVGDSLPDYETLVRLDEQNLRERFAAPKKVIDNMPEAVATEEDEEITCVICMNDVKKDEVLRVLPCKHKFHNGCIDKWFTYNGCCPIDKKRVSPPNPVNHTARSSTGPSGRGSGFSVADIGLFGPNGFSTAARQVFRARHANSARTSGVTRSRPAEQS